MGPHTRRILCSVLGVGAIVGSAHAFVVNSVAILPDESISPDVGQFVTLSAGNENRFLNNDRTVNRDFSTWDPAQNRPLVDDTTYLGTDPNGPSGFAGASESGSGGATHPAPYGTFSIGTDGVSGLDAGADPNDERAAAIVGGPMGMAWSASAAQGFDTPGGLNLVNGVLTDSVWIAHFVVDTPGAVLEGAPLAVTINGLSFSLPIDEFVHARSSGGFGLALERSPAGPNAPPGAERLDLYVVPGPAGALLLGAAGWVASRRRR